MSRAWPISNTPTHALGVDSMIYHVTYLPAQHCTGPRRLELGHGRFSWTRLVKASTTCRKPTLFWLDLQTVPPFLYLSPPQNTIHHPPPLDLPPKSPPPPLGPPTSTSTRAFHHPQPIQASSFCLCPLVLAYPVGQRLRPLLFSPAVSTSTPARPFSPSLCFFSLGGPSNLPILSRLGTCNRAAVHHPATDPSRCLSHLEIAFTTCSTPTLACPSHAAHASGRCWQEACLHWTSPRALVLPSSQDR